MMYEYFKCDKCGVLMYATPHRCAKPKRTQHRKHRGYATQRIVAAYLKDRGWPHAYAISAGESGDDIQGTVDISVEVKARRGFDPLAALKQMQARRTSALPFAVLRMDGTGEATIDDWPVVLRLEDMVALLRAAGYGDTPPVTEGEHVDTCRVYNCLGCVEL